MGRQIRFYQLEQDIYNMLFFLNQRNLYIFDSEGNTLIQVDDIYNQWVVAINEAYVPGIGTANPPIEYIVPTVIDTNSVTEARFYKSHQSTFYERKNTKGMKIIREGRFYLANEYSLDNKIASVYNLLTSYIRRNYVYSKDMYAYFSPTFIEEYRSGKVYAANGNNVFPVTDV